MGKVSGMRKSILLIRHDWLCILNWKYYHPTQYDPSNLIKFVHCNVSHFSYIFQKNVHKYVHYPTLRNIFSGIMELVIHDRNHFWCFWIAIFPLFTEMKTKMRYFSDTRIMQFELLVKCVCTLKRCPMLGAFVKWIIRRIKTDLLMEWFSTLCHFTKWTFASQCGWNPQ